MKELFLNVLMLSFLCFSTVNAQVGIGTNGAPNASSVLELQSTNKGFLPPRMANRPSNAPEGLTIYNTSTKCLEVFDGTAWLNLCDGSQVGATIASGPCQNQPAFFTFDGLVYEPVESNNKCWLDRNLGASRVAISSTDVQSYGDLYQWGRGSDGHQNISRFAADGKTTSSPHNGDDQTDRPSEVTSAGVWDGKFITISSNTNRNDWVSNKTDNAWSAGIEQTNPCPSGYRLPTQPEWETERLSWSPTNADGALASPLKLPLAGYRNRENGSVLHFDSGNYWSGTVSGDMSRRLGIFNNSTDMNANNRAQGLSVRCIKN